METPVHIMEKVILPKLGHQIATVYDLISGPPMTEQERRSRQLAEAGRYRVLERMI